MTSETFTSSLVVTDNEEPARFARALALAVKAAGPDTEVVAVTDRPHHVPSTLRRRLRLVRLRAAADLKAAVAVEAARDRLVVVGCSSVRFADGWLPAVQGAAAAMPHHIGVLGVGGHLIVVPPAVRSLDAAEAPLVDLTGITLTCAGSTAATVTGPVRLSAVLIVKDEEDVLGECLEALRAAVDEIVVYDTGSTDATVSIAESYDAVVVAGYWDDHFGNARNRALEHATGDWVLSVDADEVLTGDAASLREYCARAAADVMRIPLINTTWKGAQDGQRYQPVRFFRRERCTWTGALHEFLVEHPGTPELTMSSLVPPVRLDHSGYQYLTFTSKDKIARNLEIARAAVEELQDSGEDPITAWDGYGRSLLTAGMHREALAAFDHVLASRSNSSAVLQSGRAAMDCLHTLGDWSQADAWLEALAAHGEARGTVLVWRARQAVAAGDPDAADAFLDDAAADGGSDRWGVSFDPVGTMAARAEVALHRGDPGAALEVLLTALTRKPESIALAGLVQVATMAGVPADDLVGRLPGDFLARSAQEAVVLPTERGDEWLSALHRLRPSDPQVIVAGTVVGARGSLERAVAWSTVARGAGLPQLCPLRTLAADDQRSVLDRGVAWALLAEVAAEPGAVQALAHLLDEADEDDRDLTLTTIAGLTPGVVERLMALAGAGAALR